MAIVNKTGKFVLHHKEIPIECVNIEGVLSQFLGQLSLASRQYAANQNALMDLQKKQQDLLHEIELVDGKNASEGYKSYSRLRTVRLERRKCKTENELLKAIIDWSNANKKTMDELRAILKCNKELRAAIDSRVYGVRCSEDSEE